MDLYAENILDHYRHPRGKQEIVHPTVSHREENVSCGDDLTVALQIDDGKIIATGWSGHGCAISQAAMSLLSEELSGMTIADAANITPKHVHELLGVPVGARRLKCAMLCLHTLKNTLRKADNLPAQIWTETVAID